MKLLGFDLETHLIAPALQIPPPVCMSWAESDGAQRGASDVVLWRPGLTLLRSTLEDGETILVGANTAFDVLVSIYWSEDPEYMASLWAYAIEQGRVSDVLLRQALIERACGEHWKTYDLGSVAQRSIGLAVDKKDPWRLRFGELDGLPVAAYPPEARAYSLLDSTAAIDIWIRQEARRRNCSPYFPGYDMLADEARQVRGALPLKEMSAYGLRTNPQTVARFKAANEAKRSELRKELTAAGLMRVEYKRDWDAIAARAAALGHPLKRNTKGWSTAAGPLKASGDALLAACINWRETSPWLAANGLCDVNYVKNTEATGALLKEVFDSVGVPVPLTSCPKRKKGEPADKFEARAAKFQPSAKLDNDATERAAAIALESADPRLSAAGPLLRCYSALTSLDTVLGSPTEMAETAAREPFHAHYKTLQATGRTATGAGADGEGGKGNAQNPHRKPGVREQYEPRRPGVHTELAPVMAEDHVYLDADFSAVELHTFGQICRWVVGWSVLGDKLTASPPVDIHLEIAADIEGITYDEAKTRKKEPRISESRTAGKGINFGRKGAMGAERFVQYAWNNYRVKLGGPNATHAEALAAAKRLIGIHDARTPEFPLYSRWVQSHARTPGYRDSKFDLVHPWSGRLVAGLGFSDAHNYPFQGLASDVAKLALWYVWRAKWGLSELGKQDPLYRCGMVLFAHDSITVEVVKSLGVVAAGRLSELMYRAAREICPDVPAPAPAGIQNQLSKKAEPLENPDGSLTGEIWDAWEQAFQSACKLRTEGKDVAKGLAKDAWPDYVIEDTLERIGL